jgi:hypothetical protein
MGLLTLLLFSSLADDPPFAESFDPWLGVEVLGGATLETGSALPSWRGEASVRWRNARESQAKQASTWLTLHRFARVEAQAIDARPAWAVTAWSALFRRHVAEGSLVLSTNPPVRLPFPFDIGVTGDVLRYERRLSEGAGWSLEPLRLGLVLDPLRSAGSHRQLGFGPAAGWTLRSFAGTLRHELTPLTSLEVVFDVESDDGLWVARGVATGGFTFTPGERGVLRARGEVELSRVLLAVNDQPLSLVVQGKGAWADGGASARAEASVFAGLRLQLQSRR